MSSVWSYADKIKDGIKLSGQCHQCKKIIICSNRSTTTLKDHLKTHGIFITADIEQKKDKNNHEVQSSRQKFKTMDKFLVKQTLNEIISDLATDGASIRFITRNSFIRRAIKKEGFNLPVNERDVMKLLIEDFEQKKVNLCEKFKQMVHDGRKLSISVDEFTSIRGRRYFGLNIHDSFNNATYNTGLVRILGSCPAEDMLIIIKNHLNDFGISLDKDIVGSTQDGAAINKKFIRISNIIGQFCFNHAIHLAVCDSLYTNKQNNDEYTVEDSNDIDDEDTFEMATDFEIIETSIDNIDHHHLLKISRKIVKFIKISPIRNQIFQSKVKSIYGKEIELHLDVKHRWNSIPTMISPLIKTKAALFETFAELNSLPIINELDFEALEILEKAMDPIRVTVLALSRQDATLLTADKALNFMISKLEQLNSDISKTLLDNLKKRIDERWNKTLMDLLNCLRDPNNIPSKEVISYAGKLATRLFYNVDDDVEEVIAETEEAVSSEEMLLECELDLILQKDTVNVSKIDNKFKWLKQEFTLFKNTGERTENLEKLYKAILCIRPTSTDVERVFSVSNNFCTKMFSSRHSKRSSETKKIAKLIIKKTNSKTLTEDDYEEIKKLLHSANINAPLRCFNNDTLMHLAVRMKLPKLLEILINLNGDLKIKNNDNESTINLAEKSNHTEIIEMINAKLQQINEAVVSIENFDNQKYFAKLDHKLKIDKDKSKYLKIIEVKNIKDLKNDFCKLFPNLFAMKIECCQNDESETLNFLSRQFKDKRPLFIHFINSSSYYFRKKNSIKFEGENSADFEVVHRLIYNAEHSIDIRKEIIEKNDTFAMRFIKIFKISNEHKLVNDSIKFGSLEMLKASLYLPFFGDHENFMPEIAKLMTSVFENNESILKTAIENEKIEMCEFLIKNFKNLFTFMPFDHRKSIVNLIHEKNMDEILLKLLKIDFPFPDFKSKILSQEINDLLNDREKFKFDNIDYIKEFIEILREDENNFLRYAYDKENKSALLCALEKGKFKTYSFLKSQGFNFDKKEYSQICKKLKEMSPEKVNNFKIENAYNTQDNENYHLRLLANKFVIFGFYDNQKKLREKFNIIFKYLKDLNRISEIRPILKFCAQIEKLKITMDFENEFIFDLDPSAIDCFGSADSSSLVFVAAGRTEQEIKETIIHECCHVVVNEYYENDFKPYFSFDIENKEKFEEIVKEIKISVNGVDDGCNKIISSVFEKYDDDQHDCELIVRVLSILAFYGNKNKINELRKRYKDLFDFSQKFITDKISIEEIKKRNQVRSLNKYLDLLQDIELNMTQLKLSNHKNRTKKLKKIIKSVNNYLIVTNVPILLLINLHNCLQNLQSSLYDAKNIFIFPKSLGNDQKYKDLQNIIENRSSEFPLRLIVNFSEGKNVRAVQSDLKSIFISSSDQQEEIQTFLTENDVEFEILKIEFKWNDLTQFCQENLLKSEIKFQEKKMSLDQLINNIIINDDTILNELLFDLCYNNSISINLTEKFSEEYFIKRNFLIAPKNSKLKIQPKAVMQKQTFEQNFNKVLKSNELKIHIQNIFEYDFDQVLELTKDEKIILISDIGGSGKSRILNKIFNFFYETTDKWMIFINLRGYLNEFQKWNNQMTFLDFFNQFLSTKTREFERKIFHEFYNQGKVKILMDGFDEISPKCKDSVIEVIKSVMKSENQLWLTTRIHLEENLEQFNPKMIFSLKQLEIKKQKEFLVKYWTFKNIKNVSLQEKAEKLVSKLEKFTKKFRLINVIGMMQQLRIFADISIVNDDFNSDFFENLSMYDIYEQSVMNYIKIWKSSPLGEEEDTKLLSGINKAPNFRTIHQYYALLEYFQESVIKDFFKNEGEIWEFESVARGGIITYDKVTKKTIFIHSTYVDFFVANFILQTLSCKPNNQEFLNFAQILFEILCNIRFFVIAMFLNDKISTIKISDAIIGHLAEIINQNVSLDIFQHCIYNNYENNFDFIVNIIRKVDSEKRKKMFTYPLYQCLHSPIINENILDKVLKLYTEFFSYEEIIEILKSSCFNFYTITLYFQKPSVDFTIVKKIMTDIIKWSKNKKEDIKLILFGMFNVFYSPSLHSIIAQANDDDFEKFEYFWKLHEDYLTIDEMEKIIFEEILFAVAQGNSSKIFKYIYEKIKENQNLNFIDMFKKISKEFAMNNKLENHKSLWECIELEKKSGNLKFNQLMLEKFDNVNNYLQLVVIFNQSTEVLKFTISQIVKNAKNCSEILMSKNKENMNLLYLLIKYNKNLDFMVTLMALLREYLVNKNLKLLFSDKTNTGENFFTLALNKGNITEIHEIHQMLVELKFSVDELKFLLADENGNLKNFLIGPTKFNADFQVHKYLWWLADSYFKNDIKTFITEVNDENYNLLQIAVAYNTIEVIDLIWTKIKNYLNNVHKRKNYLKKRCSKGKNLYDIAKIRSRFNAEKWVLEVFDEYNITIVNL